MNQETRGSRRSHTIDCKSVDQSSTEQAPYAMQGELSTCMAWHARTAWNLGKECVL